MKGDFSRNVSGLTARYERLLLQQGRLHTDADLNRRSEIEAETRRTVLRDLIGPEGGGVNAGFKLTARAGLRFSGSERIDVRAARPSRLRGHGYTLEGWLCLATDARAAVLVRCGDRRSGGFELSLDPERRLIFAFAHRGLDEPVGEARLERVLVEGAGALPPGVFVHVAACVREEQVELFINGASAAAAPIAQGLPFDSAKAEVGEGFIGVIDGLRLWRVPLAADVVRLCASGASLEALADLTPEWALNDPAHRAHAENHPAPTLAEPEVGLSAGRYYVDGAAAELDAAVLFASSAGAVCGALPPSTLRRRRAGPYRAELRLRERVVTAVEDAGLADSVFGPSDTVLGVEILPAVRLRLDDVAPNPAPATLRLCRPADAPVGEPGLLRLEIHDAGFAKLADSEPRPEHEGYAIHAVHGGERLTLADEAFGTDALWRAGRPVEAVCKGRLATAKVLAVATDDAGRLTLQLGSRAGPWADIAVHHGKLRPLATFKWSRDNAADVFGVRDGDPGAGTLLLDDPGGRSDLASVGDTFELSDRELSAQDLPGPMLRIGSIEMDGAANAFRIGAQSPFDDPLRRRPEAWRRAAPIVRRWTGEGDVDAGLFTVRADQSVRLGPEFQADFSPGWCERGAFWTCAIRDNFEWPIDETGAPAAAAPSQAWGRGVELARLWFDDASVRVEDARRLFAPLAQAQPTERVLLLDIAGAGDAAEVVDVEVVASSDGAGETLVVERVREAELPAGASLFTASPRSEPGWTAAGLQIAVRRPSPAWMSSSLEAPFEGPMRVVALEQRIACLARTGEFLLFDPVSRAWEMRRPLKVSGASPLCVLDGRVHALGSDGAYDRTWHYAYDPSTDRWIERQPLRIPRRRFGMAAAGGRLYAVGGLLPQAHELSDCLEQYDPHTDAWTTRAPAPHPVYDGALIGVEGRLHLLGGRVRKNFSRQPVVTGRTAVFSPGLDRWTEGPHLAEPRAGAVAAAAADRLFVIGGEGDAGEPRRAECLDLPTLSGLEAPQPAPTPEPQAAMFGGAIYLFDTPSSGSSLRLQVCAVESLLHLHVRSGPA